MGIRHGGLSEDAQPLEEEGIENNFQIAFSVKYFSLDRQFSCVLRVTSVVDLSEAACVCV